MFHVRDFIERLQTGDVIFLKYHPAWYERLFWRQSTYVNVAMFIEDGHVLGYTRDVPYLIHSGVDFLKRDKDQHEEKFFRIQATPVHSILAQLNEPPNRSYFSFEIRPLRCVRDGTFVRDLKECFATLLYRYPGMSARRLIYGSAVPFDLPPWTEEQWSSGIISYFLFYFRVIPISTHFETIEFRFKDLAYSKDFFTAGFLGELVQFQQKQ